MVHNGVNQPCWLGKFCEKWPLSETVFSNYFYDLAKIINLFVIFYKEMPLQIFFVHWQLAQRPKFLGKNYNL
jgi:hypothetical protein